MLDAPEISWILKSAGRLATRLRPTFMAGLLTTCLAQTMYLQGAEAAAKSEEVETEKSSTQDTDTIVSQKDEVNLVEDSSVAEAVKHRPDLNFAT